MRRLVAMIVATSHALTSSPILCLPLYRIPVNTKHLYNIYTMSAQRLCVTILGIDIVLALYRANVQDVIRPN